MENLRGRERIYREFDELQNKPDINNCYTVDYWDPDNNYPDIFENLKKYLKEYANPNDFDNLLKQKINTL